MTIGTPSRRYASRVLGLVAVVTLYGFARPAPLPESDLATLARPFRFRAEPLPQLAVSARTERAVRPSLRPIAAWISSVGAAVALHDLDGDGLPNDVCSVDVRTDQVIVAPAPGTPQRYAPFDLLTSTPELDRTTTAPMGCLPADVNEDGRADLLVYFWGRSPLLFVRAGPDPKALQRDTYRVEDLVTPHRDWYTNAAILADVDGDGHADVVIGNYFADGSGVLDTRATTPMQMQDTMSRALNAGGDRLFLWGRDPSRPSGVSFRESPDAFSGNSARGWTLALGAQDLDGDLLPELYVANDFGPDRLLHNESVPGRARLVSVDGARRFTDPKSKVVGHDSFKGMGVDFADVNGDAVPDFFVSNITESYALEESNFLFVSNGDARSLRGSWRRGRAPFHDRSEQLGVARSGWGWDARFADFDNDGVDEIVQAAGFIRGSVNRWPELHELAMANDVALRHAAAWPLFRAGTDISGHGRNPFFVRAEDGRYHDVAPAVAPDRGVSRGIATADVDADGRIDYAVARQWDSSLFYRNESAHAGRAIALRLLLPSRPSSKTTVVAGTPPALDAFPAIGATAFVRLAREGAPRLTGQGSGGNGHSGKSSPELHFGLGDVAADAPVDVDLRWRQPGGALASQRLRLRPGFWTIVLRTAEAR